MLDIAEKFLGPNILCWNTILFYKKQILKILLGGMKINHTGI